MSSITDVLLVEDDVLLARQFAAHLENHQEYVVRAAHHAGEALAYINQRVPDVIILDMILPVFSGMSLLHELKSYRDTADIPVIICSSEASNLFLEEAYPYGVRRIIDKMTMQPRDIVAAIKAVV